jgi:hypothetical protein
MTNLDLVDWAMQEARHLGPAHHEHGEIKSAPSLEKLLEVLDGGRPRPLTLDTRPLSDQSHDHQKVSSHTASPDIEADRESEPAVATNLPIVVEAAPVMPAEESPAPMSPRLKAIIDPDVYTAPSDRDRAIFLRWVLRDIRANRLTRSPVDQLDLRDLIELGLVEMVDDAPLLTQAGIDAIR